MLPRSTLITRAPEYRAFGFVYGLILCYSLKLYTMFDFYVVFACHVCPPSRVMILWRSLRIVTVFEYFHKFLALAICGRSAKFPRFGSVELRCRPECVSALFCAFSSLTLHFYGIEGERKRSQYSGLLALFFLYTSPARVQKDSVQQYFHYLQQFHSENRSIFG